MPGLRPSGERCGPPKRPRGCLPGGLVRVQSCAWQTSRTSTRTLFTGCLWQSQTWASPSLAGLFEPNAAEDWACARQGRGIKPDSSRLGLSGREVSCRVPPRLLLFFGLSFRSALQSGVSASQSDHPAQKATDFEPRTSEFDLRPRPPQISLCPSPRNYD